MPQGHSKKPDDAFMNAIARDRVITDAFKKGEISAEQRSTQIVKVWSNVLTNSITIFMLVASGILGVSVFLLAMILPYFD